MSIQIELSAAFVLAIVASPLAASPPSDPALQRMALLRAMDANIDAAAARAHIDARLMLDETMPIAFLGMVAEMDGKDLKVTQIYRESGADVAGLRVGDIVRAFAKTPTDSKESLYAEIRLHPPGEVVDVRIVRDGKELVLRPTLGIRWEEDEEDEEQYGDIKAPVFTSSGLPVAFDFDHEALGSTPAALEQLLGGIGTPPKFVVVKDGDAVVLRQDAPEKAGIRFPIALVRGVDADDVKGSFRFRLVGGAQDRTAGIVLHYKDASNYLVARVNAVEGDLRVFRCVNGLRRTLPGGVALVTMDDDKWHTLEFRTEGPKVTCVLDGTITTTSYDTYFTHGRVGIWTKADSVTEFDDVSFVTPAR